MEPETPPGWLAAGILFYAAAILFALGMVAGYFAHWIALACEGHAP